MKVRLKSFFSIILLFFGVVNASFAQEEAPKRFVVFKFSPLVLLEPVGGYQIGAEVPIKQNISIQAEYAYLPYYWEPEINDPLLFATPRGFSASAYKIESRFYFTDHLATSVFSEGEVYKDLQGFYLAGQFQVKRIVQDATFLSFTNNNPDPLRLKLITTVYKHNIKVGYQRIWKSGFVLDSYVGVGLRKHFERIEPEFPGAFSYSDDMPLNIAMGTKVGWSF